MCRHEFACSDKPCVDATLSLSLSPFCSGQLNVLIMLTIPLAFPRDNLTERAMEFWLVLDDVSITDLSFGAEYSRAVEAKQVAQQDAQRAAMLVETARQSRQQKIVEAEGEAQSAALIGEAIRQNPGFLQLRRIDAAREIAATVANSTNRVYLDSDQLLLNVDQFEYDA
eukprot:TRINITY_DN8012_c0_g1_i1.p1 TRINITY_DN8012_c0_g1~~TRINITY_DN8012_c0_g1_i1.p1  ORF type:complete len:169 (+),score=49.25 TRINITY_DN8012_c0_g1_i1:635-1141(+)